MNRHERARRRSIHENLCRVATDSGLTIKRVDVPWMIEVLDSLEESGISIEQSLVLGTYMAGAAQAAIREQAVSN